MLPYVTGATPVTCCLYERETDHMHKFMQKTSKVLESSSIVFLLVLFACVLVQIIMRNFFSSGSVVLEELARFCLVSLVFLMVPVLTIDKQHIIVDILSARVPKRIRPVLEICIELLCIGLAVFLLIAVNQVMTRNWSVRTPAIRMPNILFYLPIVIGLVFMSIGAAVHTFDVFKGRKGELS
ncbi:MAG TPA: hypothetical protein DEZ27_03575 [Sphaerochaeta sp.]|nr:hypothetical protein [Sphaerochaeta sp.]